MREVGKPKDRWNQAVVNQRLSILDTSNPGYDGKQVSQKKIRRMIASVRIIWPAAVELQETP